MNERYLQVTFGGMLAGCAVPALAALNVHAQHTSNPSSTVEPGVPYLPPVPSRVCGVRRVSMALARTSPPINGDSHSACCSGVPCTTIGYGPKMVMRQRRARREQAGIRATDRNHSFRGKKEGGIHDQ